MFFLTKIFLVIIIYKMKYYFFNSKNNQENTIKYNHLQN